MTDYVVLQITLGNGEKFNHKIELTSRLAKIYKNSGIDCIKVASDSRLDLEREFEAALVFETQEKSDIIDNIVDWNNCFGADVDCGSTWPTRSGKIISNMCGYICIWTALKFLLCHDSCPSDPISLKSKFLSKMPIDGDNGFGNSRISAKIIAAICDEYKIPIFVYEPLSETPIIYGKHYWEADGISLGLQSGHYVLFAPSDSHKAMLFKSLNDFISENLSAKSQSIGAKICPLPKKPVMFENAVNELPHPMVSRLSPPQVLKSNQFDLSKFKPIMPKPIPNIRYVSQIERPPPFPPRD